MQGVRKWLMGVLGALMLAGCVSGGDRQGWHAPDWQHVRSAAVETAREPATWVPLLAAGALQIGDADHEVAEWAADDNPLFGSRSRADDASDVLRWGLVGAAATSALVKPSRPQSVTREQRLLATGLGLGTTAGLTLGLKSITGRERPNGSDDEAMPSGHASTATAAYTHLGHNLEALGWQPSAQRGARWVAGTALAANGWARLEAGEHYPSDVLVGMALGHYVAEFFSRAFMPADGNTLVRLQWQGDAAALALQHRF